jgi:hypothetical protein
VNKETHVPDWMLERYLLGELPRKKRRQLEKRLDQDPALRAELEKMRLSDRQVLSTYPPERMIPEILKRAALTKPRPASPRRRYLAWVAAPALALALFLLVILPPLIQRRLAVPENTGPGDYIGSKGGVPVSTPGLRLYRRNGGGDEILKNGETARAGDLLQLAYSSGGETHGAIVSIDGRGVVTLHYPEDASTDTALKPGRQILLPKAYELDDAPRFERFFFITARENFSLAEILEKARELAADRDQAMTGDLKLPGHLRQFSLLIRK